MEIAELNKMSMEELLTLKASREEMVSTEKKGIHTHRVSNAAIYSQLVAEINDVIAYKKKEEKAAATA
jgi:hypothetical protein